MTGQKMLVNRGYPGGTAAGGRVKPTTSFSTIPDVPCTGLLSKVSIDWSRYQNDVVSATFASLGRSSTGKRTYSAARFDRFSSKVV